MWDEAGRPTDWLGEVPFSGRLVWHGFQVPAPS
jgi:hypothetical protein